MSARGWFLVAAIASGVIFWAIVMILFLTPLGVRP